MYTYKCRVQHEECTGKIIRAWFQKNAKGEIYLSNKKI